MRNSATVLALWLLFLPVFASAQATTSPAPATQPMRRLGIILMDLTQYADSENQIRAFGGNLMVNMVNPGSRAERMGLRVGDTIHRINGKEMVTVPDVVSAIKEAEFLKIEVIRKQEALTLDEQSDGK